MSLRNCAILIYFVPLIAQGQTTWYVDDDDCPGQGSGSAVDPFCAIQLGIIAASDGDTVLVAPGTYFETIGFGGKAMTLRSSDGPSVTIIDGADLNDGVVKCISGEGPMTMLDGFTVTGGHGPDRGGMWNLNSDPTVSNCTFTQNQHGMRNDGSDPTVTSCRFIDNRGDGAGMRNIGSSPRVLDCVFVGNFVPEGINRFGGGMANLSGSNAQVIDCLFFGNSASGGSLNNDGGAMYNFESSPTIFNCVFSGNSATGSSGEGGAIFNRTSNPVITNCTLGANSAATGGGIYNDAASRPVVTNCVLWGNGGGSLSGNGNPITTYCDVEGGFSGTGNIDADPLFVDPDGDDNTAGTEDDNLRLLAGSPGIDAADNTAVPIGAAADLDGNARLVDDPGIPDTGNGTPPIVDMGAYELPPSNVHPTCDSNGPYVVECEGDWTSILVDGTGSSDPDGDELAYWWETDCPGGWFDDPASAMPVLSVDTSEGCDVACGVTLVVDDGNGGTAECSTAVTISDTEPPVVFCSVRPVQGHRLMIEYSAEDACGDVTGSAVIETSCCPLPVVDGQVVRVKCTEHDVCKLSMDFEHDTFRITTNEAALVVTATDECGNEATCVVDLCVSEDDDGDSDSDDHSDSDDEED